MKDYGLSREEALEVLSREEALEVLSREEALEVCIKKHLPFTNYWYRLNKHTNLNADNSRTHS